MTVTAPAVAAAPTTLNRITADDDLFFELHSLYPHALVNQLAYRFDERLDPELLRRWHAHLATGFIARRIRTTRFPFARAHWEPATESLPLVWSPTPLPDSEILSWFLEQAAVEFDPARGLVWQLAGAQSRRRARPGGIRGQTGRSGHHGRPARRRSRRRARPAARRGTGSARGPAGPRRA